jgi:hypothetical protein
MRLAKLSALLLLYVTVGTTLSFGQKDSDNICLTPVEFDFYADKYVRFKSLQKDTALCNAEAKRLSGVIFEQSQNIDFTNRIVTEKNAIIKGQKETYAILQERFEKKIKKNKILKNLLIGSLSVNVALVGLFMLVK